MDVTDREKQKNYLLSLWNKSPDNLEVYLDQNPSITDYELGSFLVELNPDFLIHFSKELKDNDKLIKKIIHSEKSDALKHASYRLQTDIKNATIAINFNPDFYLHLDVKDKMKKEFIIPVLKSEKWLLEKKLNNVPSQAWIKHRDDLIFLFLNGFPNLLADYKIFR